MSEINFDDSEMNSEMNSDFTDEISDGHSSLADQPLAESTSHPVQFTNESATWEFRSKLAPFESEKEYFVFKSWLESGSGRSLTYTAKLYNMSLSLATKISNKNNWGQRVIDYDRHQLQIMQAAENTRRAQEHKRKLEEYRLQQEFIGRSLSSDAAKLAAIVSNTLDKFMMNDREIDIRDLPAVLNAANKAAEVGRNLQSSSLGVDQLLTALEEIDE